MEMEAKTKAALDKLDGEHAGTYYPLTGMSKETQKQLTEDHFLFNDSDRWDYWRVSKSIYQQYGQVERGFKNMIPSITSYY